MTESSERPKEDSAISKTQTKSPLNPSGANSSELIKEFLEEGNGSLTISHESFHVGPIPSPESLGKYDGIIPGGAERILVLAEKQADHRRTIELLQVKADIKTSICGQWFAFLIAITFAFIGLYLAINNHTIAACTIFTTTVGGLVGAFLFGQQAPKTKSTQPETNPDDK